MSDIPNRGRRRAPLRGAFVYFIQAASLRLIKIGSAVEPMDRLYTLQCGSPDKLDLLGVIRSDEAQQLERGLHRRFAKARRHGEWFEPTDEMLATIKRCAKDYDRLLSDENRERAGAAFGPRLSPQLST